MRPAVTAGKVLWPWLVATVLSGIPSTLYALITGGDPLEATRAAAAMIVAATDSFVRVLGAAALVHGAVSLFWTLVLVFLLPTRNTIAWSLLASAAIALLDLRIVAPRFFPEVAALAFWPQFADHLMWGACVGITVRMQRRPRG